MFFIWAFLECLLKAGSLVSPRLSGSRENERRNMIVALSDLANEISSFMLHSVH